MKIIERRIFILRPLIYFATETRHHIL